MKSRSLFTLIIGCAVPFLSLAQGLINNGAHIVITNGSNIYVAGGASGNFTTQAVAFTPGQIDNASAGGTIYVEGNWIDNNNSLSPSDAIFSNNGSTVILNGANQLIGGSAYTRFYNLTLLGSGTKTLNIMCSVGGTNAPYTGVLSLGTRPLDLNGNTAQIWNPLPGGITNTSGYIISETNVASNPSVVDWELGSNTGTYIVPFGVGGSQIPLTLAITSGMPASFYDITFATRATTGSNNVPWSTGVTQMFDPTLGQDGSDEAVIDRWWDIKALGSMVANVTFSYRGSENTLQVPYNTGNLGAQYWDSGLGWVPDNSTIGSAPAVLAGVGSVTAPGLTFGAFVNTPFVLSSVIAPLPIELISFNAACNDKNEILNWSTASEINNDYFTVERSDDGNTFYDIGNVNGSGTTSQQHNYSFTDPQQVSGNSYYRIRQTDYNGQHTNSTIIVAQGCGTQENVVDAFASGPGINLIMNTAQQTNYAVSVFDDRGRMVINQDISAAEGANHFLLNGIVPSTGIYLVRITGNDGKTFVKRLFVSAE